MKKLLIITIMLLSFLPNVEGQSLKADFQDLLEEFCQKFYDNCFSGRNYIKHSLIVTSIELNGNTVRVKGRHNYKGYIGRTYTDVDFKADVTYEPYVVTLVFYKWYNGIIDGHWESCEKSWTAPNSLNYLEYVKSKLNRD